MHTNSAETDQLIRNESDMSLFRGSESMDREWSGRRVTNRRDDVATLLIVVFLFLACLSGVLCILIGMDVIPLGKKETVTVYSNCYAQTPPWYTPLGLPYTDPMDEFPTFQNDTLNVYALYACSVPQNATVLFGYHEIDSTFQHCPMHISHLYHHAESDAASLGPLLYPIGRLTRHPQRFHSAAHALVVAYLCIVTIFLSILAAVSLRKWCRRRRSVVQYTAV